MHTRTQSIKRALLALCVGVLSPLPGLAQQSPDFMRSTGKFYVVIAVLAVILILMFGYLFSMDRKISRIENHMSNEHQDKD